MESFVCRYRPSQIAMLSHALPLMLAASPWSATMAQDSPDLRPEISNVTVKVGQTVSDADVVEGCAAASTGRTLLAFDHLAWNDGPGEINLGDPGCPNCDTDYVPVCSNPLFECSAAGGHNHAHLKNFSAYTVTKRGQSGAEVRGHKEGFCLVNSVCKDGTIPPPGGNCNQLAAGCADVYSSGLGCQYVDITHLRPGKYTLHVELNPLRTITEASYENNVQTFDFEVCRRTTSNVTFTFGPGDPSIGGRRPFTIEAVLNFSSAAALKDFNPIDDGLSPQLMVDTRYAFYPSTTLPPGKPGSGCFPQDGWKRLSEGKWEFRSDSELDAQCAGNATGGIRSAVVERRDKTLFITLRGRLDPTLLPPLPESAFFSVAWTGAPSTSTNGTCWPQATAARCSRVGPGKIAVKCK